MKTSRFPDAPSQVLGRRRITKIEGWGVDYVHMLGPGHIQFERNGGQIEFGAVQIGLECWYSPTGAHFNFHGSDEGAEVSETAMPISSQMAQSLAN